jgi:hypothetical protein
MGKTHEQFADLGMTIAAVAVGLSPGFAILAARSIAWLLHRTLWPRPEVAPEPGHALARWRRPWPVRPGERG